MAYAEQTFTPQVGADGTATVSLKVANGLDTWTVSQVSVEMPDAPSGATCYLRKNGYPVTPIIPTGDTASGEPPVVIRPSDLLTIEWQECTPDTSGRVIFFYDDGRS
jgi:hypothetical protein